MRMRRRLTTCSIVLHTLLQGVTRCCKVLQSVIGVTQCYTVLHDVTGCYTALRGDTEIHGVIRCYRAVLQGVTQCYKMLQRAIRCCTVLQGVARCYRVLLANIYTAYAVCVSVSETFSPDVTIVNFA